MGKFDYLSFEFYSTIKNWRDRLDTNTSLSNISCLSKRNLRLINLFIIKWRREIVLGRNVDFIDNPRLGMKINSEFNQFVFFLDDRDRPINWYSIFPFTDNVILKNIIDNKNFPFDLNVCQTNQNFSTVHFPSLV